MPRWIRFLTILALLSSASVMAQEKRPLGPDGKPLGRIGTEVDIRYLYPCGKFFDYESLFPVVLEYQNQTKQAQYFVMDWKLSSEVPKEYETIQVEPGGKKRIPLFLPPRQASQLFNLKINGQALSPGLQSNSQNRITGLLTADSKNLDYLRSLQLEKNPYYSATNQNSKDVEEYGVPGAMSEIHHQVFPRHWGLLSSLRIMICYDLNSLNLSRDQLQAITRWVEDGGRLVILSNGIPGEFKGNVLSEILPMRPTDSVSKEAGLFVGGPLVGGAKILSEYDGHPLLVSRELLDGKVFFITTPLVDLNLLGKDKTEALWRQVFNDVDPNQREKMTVLQYSALNSIPELPRTQAGWIALFVILYGLVVGPINLSILRKKDKMLFAFVTVPVVALLFAGSAYVVNRVMRPSEPVMRELGWLALTQGQTTGTAEAEQVLFSPISAGFTLSTDTTTTFDIYRNNYRSQERTIGVYQLTAQSGLKSSVELGTWDVQRFNTASVMDFKEPVSLSVEYADKTAKIKIKTPFQSDGKSAVLVNSKYGMTETFQLQAGEKDYSLKITSKTAYPSSNLNFDSEEFPGRNELVDRVWNKLNQQSGKSYLLFWTPDIETPIKVGDGVTSRHDYLVTVEAEQ